ncbi:MAG: glycoside hydrolase family 15 protein, partial [Armatimonadota bacterium]|nr:glycoside hydrolase family 15 protein [Armatimonadota bacterium]
MPRDLVLGNGTLLVNLDRNLNIRDLYYPHVGLYNHVGGYKNRIGVWVDGQFSWLEDTWLIRIGYKPRALITDVHASNGRLGIGLRFNDTVHPELNLLLRRVSVENLHPEEREIRLFFSHDFRIFETDVGDTAFFHPFTGAIVHYKRDCYILINGRAGNSGIYEYAVGIKDFGGAEGTWRDAEDGSLSMHPIEQGSVDSTVSFRLTVPADGSGVVDYWLAVGNSLDEVAELNSIAAGNAIDELLGESAIHWSTYLKKGKHLDHNLSQAIAELYERSLLILQTQLDRCGGIVAANDTDIMQTARAHYSYVWPRDGALVANALDMAGYPEPARRFFSFCTGLLRPDTPFFLQKYCPDGTVGATWHPWIADGEPEIPYQQDSTALVLWAVWKHCERYKDKNYALAVYEDLAVPVADYIVEHLDQSTKLPQPSYDLWEQRRGIHLWTCSTVYGALSAAARLAGLVGDNRAAKYQQAREVLRNAIQDEFYDPSLGRFVRSIYFDGKKTEDHHENAGTSCQVSRLKTVDPTLDASMAGIFLFGVLPPDSPQVVATMEAIYDRLWVRTPIGGIARYEDDYYFQVSSDVKNIPGNPWFVSTLWMADWYILVARSVRDLEPALDLLQWVTRHASEAGLLAEQIHPFTGQPLAVMPLTWSHAAFVSTVQS